MTTVSPHITDVIASKPDGQTWISVGMCVYSCITSDM